jgi:hypothetical protein
MPLKNYTTEVAVDKSVEEIRKLLVNHGIRDIGLTYSEAKQAVGLSFAITVRGQVQLFALPCRWEAVQKVLIKQKVEPRYQTQQHAQRVAWRILKGWIENQLALIELDMVQTHEVFLPYRKTRTGKSVFDTIDSGESPQLLLN